MKEGISGSIGGRSSLAESRWNQADFSSTYDSPGWRRAQTSVQPGTMRARPPTLEAEARLITTSSPDDSGFQRGDKVIHAKFGRGHVTHADGNKLTVRFETAGEKKVVAAFLSRG
jgi:DNA helicase-2/ATP-dependent DNA helicase PcrA